MEPPSTVDPVDPPAFLHLVSSITTSHDGRDAQLARDDGGVAGTATAVGDDGTSLLPWQDCFLNSYHPRKTIGKP